MLWAVNIAIAGSAIPIANDDFSAGEPLQGWSYEGLSVNVQQLCPEEPHHDSYFSPLLKDGESCTLTTSTRMGRQGRGHHRLSRGPLRSTVSAPRQRTDAPLHTGCACHRSLRLPRGSVWAKGKGRPNLVGRLAGAAYWRLHDSSSPDMQLSDKWQLFVGEVAIPRQTPEVVSMGMIVDFLGEQCDLDDVQLRLLSQAGLALPASIDIE